MWKKIWIVFGCLGLIACQSNVPDKTVEFSDFIPVVTEKKSADFLAESDFHFAEENFPKECEWLPLVRIVDGDTIVVEENVRVRLVGVDTPETKHPNKPIESFGLEASAKMKELLKNADEICLIVDKVEDYYDRYGRRLGYIFTAEGIDINAELLHSGMAKAYTAFPFERKEEFVFFEQQAQEKKIGRWK